MSLREQVQKMVGEEEELNPEEVRSIPFMNTPML
jgi:hypothetical protein